MIETNLSSVFYTCRAVTRPMMKKRAGSIVNISSDRRCARQLGPDELRRVEGGHHRLHEVARARARLAQRARERRRPRLREDAADRRAARGGDAGDDRERRRSGASPSRTKSPGRYASSPPTRRRSSPAKCCSSTADWGCDERERTTARRDHGARHGQPARQRRAVVVVAAARGRVGRGRDHRVRPHRTTTSTSPAS